MGLIRNLRWHANDWLRWYLKLDTHGFRPLGIGIHHFDLLGKRKVSYRFVLMPALAIWANENMPGRWRMRQSRTGWKIEFYSAIDLIHFKLRWSEAITPERLEFGGYDTGNRL